MKEKKNCNVEIGKRLKQIRENMNYSQAGFAEILDVSDDHYRRLEWSQWTYRRKTAAFI